MKITNNCAVSMILVSSLMMPNMLLAGSADMETSDGNRMKFEYEGDSLRVNTGQEGGYMIINDDGMYVVTDSDGHLMVIDAGKMMGMFGGMAATAPSVASSKVVSLKATGKREDYAGMKGEVYELEYIEEGSEKTQTTDLVLSDDPRAIQLTKAITDMASSMVKAAGQSLEGADELQEYMSKLDKGVLRYGNDMWVTGISSRTVASARFVLPAEPTDLSGMAGIADLLNQANSSQGGSAGSNEPSGEKPEKKKGLVSGFLSKFGKKADRQQDRVEGKVDGTVDEATDEAVDSAVDRALDKIFGN